MSGNEPNQQFCHCYLTRNLIQRGIGCDICANCNLPNRPNPQHRRNSPFSDEISSTDSRPDIQDPPPYTPLPLLERPTLDSSLSDTLESIQNDLILNRVHRRLQESKNPLQENDDQRIDDRYLQASPSRRLHNHYSSLQNINQTPWTPNPSVIVPRTTHRRRAREFPELRNLADPIQSELPNNMSHQSNNDIDDDVTLKGMTIKIIPFSGNSSDSSQDLETLISNLDLYAEMHGKSEAWKCKKIPFFLKSSAHFFWRQLDAFEKSDYKK